MKGWVGLGKRDGILGARAEGPLRLGRSARFSFPDGVKRLGFSDVVESLFTLFAETALGEFTLIAGGS